MPKATHHTSAAHASAQQLADSAAHDSTQQHAAAAVYHARFPQGLPTQKGNDSAYTHMEQMPVMTVPMADSAKPYGNSPLHDTGAMSLLLLGVFFIIVTYRTGYKYIENFAHNIFSVKMRENLFDDHTVTDTQILSALIVNTCIMEGFMLFFGINADMPQLRASLHANVFMHIGCFAALALAFYVAQLLLYWLLGYIFGNKMQSHILLDGFKATQSLLGLLLFPLTVIMLVYHTLIHPLLIAALCLYGAARVAFIYKGFRIFFTDFSSILFFILYLCSVEIVPPILVYLGATNICFFLQS